MVTAYIKLMRPHHYIKNGFLFVPLFFAHQFTDMTLLLRVACGFVGFCLVTSAVYVFNDLIDISKDQLHPLKRHRPLAAGEVRQQGALFFLGGLLFLVLLANILIADREYSLVVLLYMGLNVFYSLLLQRIPVVDSLCVAAGFVLRIFAGAVIIDVPVSGWLTGLTLLLALFLTFSKRRCDILAGGKELSVAAVSVYNLRNLSIIIGILAATIALGYVSYTISPAVIMEHQAPYLYFSGFWVILGVARYLCIVFRSETDCSPVTVVLRDVYLQVIVLLWLFTLWLLIYT